MGPPISSPVKVGYEAINYMRLRRQDVDGICIRIGRSSILHFLNVWPLSARSQIVLPERLTCDVFMKNIVFLDGIIHELLAP